MTDCYLREMKIDFYAEANQTIIYYAFGSGFWAMFNTTPSEAEKPCMQPAIFSLNF